MQEQHARPRADVDERRDAIVVRARAAGRELRDELVDALVLRERHRRAHELGAAAGHVHVRARDLLPVDAEHERGARRRPREHAHAHVERLACVHEPRDLERLRRDRVDRGRLAERQHVHGRARPARRVNRGAGAAVIAAVGRHEDPAHAIGREHRRREIDRGPEPRELGRAGAVRDARDERDRDVRPRRLHRRHARRERVALLARDAAQSVAHDGHGELARRQERPHVGDREDDQRRGRAAERERERAPARRERVPAPAHREPEQRQGEQPEQRPREADGHAHASLPRCRSAHSSSITRSSSAPRSTASGGIATPSSSAPTAASTATGAPTATDEYAAARRPTW